MTDLLVDTSVAVPLVVSSHQPHRFVEAAVGERSVALAGHALHETYAILTRLPGDARLAPADAVRLLDERFDRAVLARSNVAGGATYDGLIALAARSAGRPLASRDRRAEATYRKLGVAVELLT